MEAALMRAALLWLLLAARAVPAASAASADLTPKEAEVWAKLHARIEAVDRGLDGVRR